MKKNRLRVLLLSVLCVLLLTGCDHGTGIGDMAVILGAAIGSGENQQITVTVELAHKASLDGEDESIIVTAQADDWQGIEEALTRKCDKELYWGHLVLLLFETDCGKERMAELMKLFYLDQRLAPVIYTAVCFQDGKAVLEQGFGEAAYASQGIAQYLSREMEEDRDACLTVEKCMQSFYHGRSPQMISMILTDSGSEFDRMVDIDDI